MSHKAPQGQYVPGNFVSHRLSWRRAIEECINRANSVSTMQYWQHELEAFDRSFARLLDKPEQVKPSVDLPPEVEKLAATIKATFDDFTRIMGKAELKLSQSLQPPAMPMPMPTPNWYEVAQKEIGELRAELAKLKASYDIVVANRDHFRDAYERMTVNRNGVSERLAASEEAQAKEVARLDGLLNMAHSDIDTYETQSEAHQEDKVRLREENRMLRDRLQKIADALK